MKKNANTKVQTLLFRSDTSSDFPEFQDKTHPVPIGWESAISGLQHGKIKPITAMLIMVANYFSFWKSNKSHYLSINNFAEYLGIVPSYVCKALKQANRWLKKLKSNRKGTIYEITKHDYAKDVPDAERDSTFLAMPYGFGSPMERLFNGHITWKSCLVWIILKVHSDWITGITNPTNMLELAKLCRMGAQTICECIRELEEVGLLKRLSAKNEAAVYQLLPKPKKKKEKDGHGENRYGYSTSTHQYSRNRQYRICFATGNFEKRTEKSLKGRWKPQSDYDIYNTIPKKIVEDLKEAFDHYCNAQAFRLGLEGA